MAREPRFEPKPGDLQDVVVKINRCAKVMRGGRRFSFSALVVIGDQQGRVGVGFGKANEVPASVEKANKDARKNVQDVTLVGGTIPHPIEGRCGASRVRLLPAAPGTGVVAGGAVRAVVELAGVRDILTKAYGSTNPVNLVKATVQALTSLRSRQQVEAVRGVTLEPLAPEAWAGAAPKEKAKSRDADKAEASA
ncbi:MAG: 30S ribosomal protein S5 [Planctomycetota bacterium]|jgi:small subunit ribosomal protein S5